MPDAQEYNGAIRYDVLGTEGAAYFETVRDFIEEFSPPSTEATNAVTAHVRLTTRLCNVLAALSAANETTMPINVVPLLEEMHRAERLHGERFTANIPLLEPLRDRYLLFGIRAFEQAARSYCEASPTQVTVLIEEVCEVCDAILEGTPVTDELLQVAAVAYTMYLTQKERESVHPSLPEDAGTSRTEGSTHG